MVADIIDVEVKNLTKTFGNFNAVNNISFSVERGSFFSILGPSGCGKTTVLRMISGFEVPNRGEILIGNECVNNVPPNRRRTNLVFQHLALFPLKTIFNNVSFGLQRLKIPKNEIKQRVTNMLERVGLQGFESRYPNQLSGGQKQRVAIARSLVLEPTVLLLDEPLGALDLKLREHMKLELKKLQNKVGTTFIYITHDQGEAMTMSDQVGVMLKGEMEQIGTPEELYNAPATPFVAAFVGDANRFSGRVFAKSNESVTISIGPLKVKGIPQPELGDEREALCFLRPQNIRLQPPDDPVSKGYQSFPGLIREIIFEGHIRSYIVELAEDFQLKVAIAHATRARSFSVADQVQVVWNPNDTLCFSTRALADIDMNVGEE